MVGWRLAYLAVGDGDGWLAEHAAGCWVALPLGIQVRHARARAVVEESQQVAGRACDAVELVDGCQILPLPI